MTRQAWASPPVGVASKAATLRRLEMEMTRRVDGLLSGDHLAHGRGSGSEPAGVRDYGPGDDARRIDWNLTARSLGPQVRTTEPDRELETWIVADASASLDFGTTFSEKRDVVLAAVAAFGFLGMRGGNRVGVAISGGTVIERRPAQAGRGAVMAALARLYDAPRRAGGPGQAGTLAQALDDLARTQARRSRIVVISDFLEPDDWSEGLRRLSLRHQVLAVHVIDPRELALPAVGMLAVIDPETGRRLYTQTNSTKLRTRYAAAAQARTASIRQTIQDADTPLLELRTDQDWLFEVVRFIGRRRRATIRTRVPSAVTPSR